MSENEIRNYWIIFRQVKNGVGEMVCVVGDEDVAIQFCRDFKDHYYMSREECL